MTNDWNGLPLQNAPKVRNAFRLILVCNIKIAPLPDSLMSRVQNQRMESLDRQFFGLLLQKRLFVAILILIVAR